MLLLHQLLISSMVLGLASWVFEEIWSVGFQKVEKAI
jgi:hypothetical protein